MQKDYVWHVKDLRGLTRPFAGHGHERGSSPISIAFGQAAYRRAWMAAARARASTKSGEAAARKKEPVAALGKSYLEGSPKIRIPNNWAPRNYQMNVWRYLERGGKRAICVWHRRAGKDDVCLHWAAASMIDKPATYWHMLPAFSQGRKAIWTAVNPALHRQASHRRSFSA